MKETTQLNRSEILFFGLSTLFCTLVVISNMIAAKLFEAPFFEGFSLSAGLITYPLSFIISDLVTELYGEKKAKFMVCCGLSMNLLALFLIQLAIALPAGDPVNHEIFSSAFEISSFAMLGSMTAYITAQLIDIKIFGTIKRYTNDRHLWLRNNASTLISQLIDTVIVDTVFFYCGFGYSIHYVLKVIFVSYTFKAFFSMSITPLFYLAVYMAKKFLSSTNKASITFKPSRASI